MSASISTVIAATSSRAGARRAAGGPRRGLLRRYRRGRVALVHAHRSGRTRVLVPAGRRRRLGLPRARLGRAAGRAGGDRPDSPRCWAASGTSATTSTTAATTARWATRATGRSCSASSPHSPAASSASVSPTSGTPRPAWVRITSDWRVPMGGVLLVGCMAFGLVALGLDDVWHRIFGQDVTLWSPTHFVFLCGGILTVIGMVVLLKEGSIARGASAARFAPRRSSRAGGESSGWPCSAACSAASSCSWPSTTGAYPLYRQVWQPLLLAAFAGFIFTAARSWAGPGGAIGAWAVYLGVRADGNPRAVRRRRVGLLDAALPGGGGLRRAARAPPRSRRSPIAFGALRRSPMRHGRLRLGVRLVADRHAAPVDRGAPAGRAICAALAGLAGRLLGALFAGALRGALPPRRIARAACVGAFAAAARSGDQRRQSSTCPTSAPTSS